jgi:hypothetical protein
MTKDKAANFSDLDNLKKLLSNLDGCFKKLGY